jgi:hypothetical protein
MKLFTRKKRNFTLGKFSSQDELTFQGAEEFSDGSPPLIGFTKVDDDELAVVFSGACNSIPGSQIGVFGPREFWMRETNTKEVGERVLELMNDPRQPLTADWLEVLGFEYQEI